MKLREGSSITRLWMRAFGVIADQMLILSQNPSLLPSSYPPFMDQAPPQTTEGQLSDYVQKARTAGMADEEIRQELLKAGWSDTEVTFLFGQVASPAVGPSQTPSNAPKKAFGKRNLLIVFTAILLGAVGVIAASQYGDNNEVENGTASVSPQDSLPIQTPTPIAAVLKHYENSFLRFSYPEDYEMKNNIIITDQANARYRYHAISLNSACCLYNVVFFPRKAGGPTREDEIQRFRDEFADARNDLEEQGLENYAQDRLEDVVIDGRQGLRVFQSAIDDGEHFRMGRAEVSLPIAAGLYKIDMNWRVEELNDTAKPEHRGFETILNSFDILEG